MTLSEIDQELVWAKALFPSNDEKSRAEPDTTYIASDSPDDTVDQLLSAAANEMHGTQHVMLVVEGMKRKGKTVAAPTEVKCEPYLFWHYSCT